MTTKQNNLADFSRIYPLQKTLRFALKPIGKTGEHIEKNNFLKIDEERAERYKTAKKIIDEYHKWFIEKTLAGFEFNKEDLQKFKQIYTDLKDKKKSADKKEYESQQKNLRKKLHEAFSKQKEYQSLFKKELIKNDMPNWLRTIPSNGIDAGKFLKNTEVENIEKASEIIKSFDNWTTYFKGFNENRENIYTSESHSTAIAYRVVHENLPKFIDNLLNYEKAIEKGIDFSKVESWVVNSTNISNLSEVFSLVYFNRCINQSGIDLYNTIRGGVSKDDGGRNQGVNEIINLASQQYQKENDIKTSKEIRSLGLSALYKQILSDRKSLSFLPEAFSDDKEMIESIKTFYQEELGSFEHESKIVNVIEQIKELVAEIGEYSLDKIYLSNNKALTEISQQLFGDWGIVKRAMEQKAEEEFPTPKNGRESVALSKRRAKWIAKQKYISIAEISTMLDDYLATRETDETNAKTNTSLTDYFKELTVKKESENTRIFEQVSEQWKSVDEVLNREYLPQQKTLMQDEDAKQKIKELLDSIQEVLHFVKPLYVNLKSLEDKGTDVYDKDSAFYNEFDPLYEQLELIIPLYNKVRNYLTQKGYTEEKYKLNFENHLLLKGWDLNKEAANTCALLKKDGEFFLGIMHPNKDDRKLFDQAPPSATKDNYQKVMYKLLPGPNKMLPKVFFSKEHIQYYNPNEEILDIRNHSSHTKNGEAQEGFEKKDFKIDDCHQLIDFFKDCIKKHPEWKDFDFKFSPTKSYNSIDEFYHEVEKQGYKLNIDKTIDSSYIDDCVARGRLYLFKIYNKDFSEKSKGKPNLHTLYWKALFEPINLKDVVFKLNGEAEVFFRKPSITKKNIHTKNEKIIAKTYEITENGKKVRKAISNSVYRVLIKEDDISELSEEEKKDYEQVKAHLQYNTFDYDIVKDNRYTKEQYSFHVPITINFAKKESGKFNDKVNDYLRRADDVNVVSIDRGERHLAFATLLNQQGVVLEQFDFNLIESNTKNNYTYMVDYQDKLDKLEQAREKARKSWKSITKIKDLKSGYLSQVVHRISKLVVENNAIVVFEDLNFGFKKGRMKIEKQVYQKLEKMLIEKLNYLVFKDRKIEEPGGLLKGFQLTPEFESFKKLGKQSGFIFYVPSYYTSKICPVTGFVNMIYDKRFKNNKELIKNFKSIRFNKTANNPDGLSGKGYFEFEIDDYTKFNPKATGCKPNWTVCTYGERIKTKKNTKGKWESETVDVTNELKKLLENKNISLDGDLKNEILKQDEKKFFDELVWLLKLTLQMRNSETGSTKDEDDYCISPVADRNGKFFDSREYAAEYNKNGYAPLPVNADANGAYHIGLKGLWILEQIKKTEKGKKLNLAISNEEWFEYAQNKPFLKK